MPTRNINLTDHFDDLLGQRRRRETWDVEAHTYMSYWYGGLYVVIEGWTALKLHDPEIDQLLRSQNVRLLREYRNGVFHFQRRYFDQKFLRLITRGENVVDWVRSLNRTFGRFFLARLRSHAQQA